MSIKWMSHVWETSPYEGKALLLHLALADYANDGGTCFPSQKTLAEKARTTTVWVRVSLRKMVDDGLLEVLEKGEGRGNRTVYQLLNKRESNFAVCEEGETEFAEKVKSDSPHTYIKNRHEPSITVQEDFIKFWKAYPRKVGKLAAQKEFNKIMATTDAPSFDYLLKKVVCYAKQNNDQRFIAHPATWLRQGRWMDEDIQQTTETELGINLKNIRNTMLTYRNAGFGIEQANQYLSEKTPEEQEFGMRVFTEGIV